MAVDLESMRPNRLEKLFAARTKFPIWMFPKIGAPQNGWFIMENPIKMDDLGVPLFSETSISSMGCLVYFAKDFFRWILMVNVYYIR